MTKPAGSWTLRRAFMFVGRVGLGLIFLYAAYTKLRHPWPLFALSIDSYRLLPEWAVIVVARTLPWLELALGLLLLVGWRLHYVASAATGILLAFFVVMLRAYFLGLGIDCGCFGVGEALSEVTLMRDGLLLLLAFTVAVDAFARARRAASLRTAQTDLANP
jgi:uncharacterized membrane protein YphA (DoxX/SURF4 family)